MVTYHNLTSKLLKFFGLCAIIICGGFLFYVSLEARHAEESLARVKKQILQEQQAIAVLKAEITHLSHPTRLEKIASNQDYILVSSADFVALNAFTQEIPLLSEIIPSAPLPKTKPLGLKTAQLY